MWAKKTHEPKIRSTPHIFSCTGFSHSYEITTVTHVYSPHIENRMCPFQQQMGILQHICDGAMYDTVHTAPMSMPYYDRIIHSYKLNLQP